MLFTLPYLVNNNILLKKNNGSLLFRSNRFGLSVTIAMCWFFENLLFVRCVLYYCTSGQVNHCISTQSVHSFLESAFALMCTNFSFLQWSSLCFLNSSNKVYHENFKILLCNTNLKKETFKNILCNISLFKFAWIINCYVVNGSFSSPSFAKNMGMLNSPEENFNFS